MYGKDINEWLNNKREKPEAYDFTKEIVSSIESNDTSEDAIDRYVIYQATAPNFNDLDEAQSILKGHEVYSRSGHADECELIEGIYGILWPKRILIHCKGGKWITGETMNSVNTTIDELLKIETGDKSIKQTIIRYADEGKGGKLLKKSIQNYPHAEGFLNAAYTIGNFIPVPVGCNGPRGYQNHDIEDYWDKTLWLIYCWYQSPDRMKLKKIVKYNKNVSRYEDWLDALGSWDQFVVTNFMQDFVYRGSSNDQSVFGKPKELWEDHLKDDAGVLPKLEQLDEFFKNAAEWIFARGARMINVLRTKEDIA